MRKKGEKRGQETPGLSRALRPKCPLRVVSEGTFSQKALVSFPRSVCVNVSGGNRLEMFKIMIPALALPDCAAGSSDEVGQRSVNNALVQLIL